ncbi:unnamed protein product [Dovyalis caffra]|uniref:Uncharacterized protein n=1 Tax=Dovyalis caffra TaxID=77055 RepID=A0AAV1QVT6_9ROSI|nr:unnamed protein product [Dovyalis caffra]
MRPERSLNQKSGIFKAENDAKYEIEKEKFRIRLRRRNFDSFLLGHFQLIGAGINTERGLLMARISEDTGEETPLKVSSQLSVRLKKLATFIGIVGLVVALFVLGILLGRKFVRFFTGNTKNPDGSFQFIKGETSVRIVVVAVPVGLLLFVTLIVAYGEWKIREAKALQDKALAAKASAFRRLSACESMGSAKAICSDETGTLTRNQAMRSAQESLFLGSSSRITAVTSNWSSSSDSDDVAIMDSAPKAREDAKAENSNSCDQEGSSGAKKVRSQGHRHSGAKAAIHEQKKAIQPTPLLTGLQNHPSIYIRLGRPTPIRGLTPQNVWNLAFDIWSTTAEIRRIMINLPGYMCALAERYFSETHTLHLGTFEIGPTPLAWTVIIGIRFCGDPLNPSDITSADCAKLLGLEGPTGVISEGKVKLDALCPSTLDFSKDPTNDDRDWMFRRLIVYLVGSCFFSGTDLMVPIHLVSAMSNIQESITVPFRDFTLSCYSGLMSTFPVCDQGVDAWDLVEDEGRDYADWFRTHSLGRIVKLEQSLRDTSDKWKEKCQSLETTLKTVQEESQHWKELAEAVEGKRKFWENQFIDAQKKVAKLAAQKVAFI